MTDEYADAEVPNEAAENTEATESTEGDASSTRRGRPRDPGVIERDARVLEALQPGQPKTKADLASELGLEPSVVYLSLWRLHKDGQVERNQRVWQRV